MARRRGDLLLHTFFVLSTSHERWHYKDPIESRGNRDSLKMTRGGAKKLPITIGVPIFKRFVGEKVVKIIEKQKLGLGGIYFCILLFNFF